MARQSNGMGGRRGRGSPRGMFRGRGRGRGGNDLYIGGRGGIQKPPPLMSRPLPPPNNRRLDLHGPHGPMPPPLMPTPMPHNDDWYGRLGPPHIPNQLGMRSSRGAPNLRMGPRGRNSRPPLRGMLPTPRPRPPGGLLPPPPMPMQRHPGPPGPLGPPGPPGPPGHMFRPRPPIPPRAMTPLNMRGRGMPTRMPRGMPRGRGGIINRGGAPNIRKGGKPTRGRGAKTKNSNSPSQELNKPWVTEAIKNEILKKHKLHQKAKKARSKKEWNELWEAFKEHRNKVTTMLREAKLEYIGAHPDEDVDKILAEATNQLCSKEDTSDNEAIATPTIDTEGAEPMDEGGAAIEAETSQAPQIEMTADSKE
ncbi:hypothetical protein Anas_07264 [Armadillidium nasatum]|uniref:DNA-binding protein K10 n=1 Tax=Armadillidium nasatum TaxID=96803 RepID=A0A5N5TA57_9CRUS|nr:hypothetical protein Anas_07264 [Armadillidium nasatum]